MFVGLYVDVKYVKISPNNNLMALIYLIDDPHFECVIFKFTDDGYSNSLMMDGAITFVSFAMNMFMIAGVIILCLTQHSMLEKIFTWLEWWVNQASLSLI